MSESGVSRFLNGPHSRAAAAFVLCLAAVVAYAARLGLSYPLRDWLFWRMAVLWLWCAFLCTACFAAGHVILVRVLRTTALPPLEMLVQSTALGLLVFVLGMYIGGFAHLYGATFAVVWPLLMIAAGARSAFAWSLERWRAWRQGAESRSRGEVLATRMAFSFGLVALVFVYLGVMTPDAINFDASWSHIPIAADYARAGRIIPFDGDYTRNFPHLTSLVHTWAMTVPAWRMLTEPPLRWMLALHLQFVWFLWTLAGVGAVTAWLLERDHLGGAWAAFFLFPAIFVYDKNLGGASDHDLAFFACPFFLAAMRCARDASPRSWIAAGAFAGAALLTKYQALYLIVGVGVVTAFVWATAARASTAQPRSRWLAGPATLVVTLALVVSPHFLKNWAFYGNPGYPFLQDVFPSHPTTPHAAYFFDRLFKQNAWCPHGTLLQNVVDSLRLCFVWPFEAHYTFTHSVPDGGALFTLLAPMLLLVRSRGRIVLAYAAGGAALFTWAMVFRVDRHLQTFMPLLVAATAALLVRAWELGWLSRAGLSLLVGLQVVWGADAPFYSGFARIQSSIDLIRSGFEGRAAQRFQGFRSVDRAIGAALPPNARVVLHTYRPNLGIDHDLVLDWAGQQGLILYEGVRGPRGMFDLYRSIGATHLLWVPEHQPAPTLQEDVLFSDFIHRFGRNARPFGREELVELPSEPPPPDHPYQVLALGMAGYADGLYQVEALSRYTAIPDPPGTPPIPNEPFPADPAAQADLVTRADAVCVAEGVQPSAPLSAGIHRFELAATYPGAFAIRVRPRPQ